MEKKVVKFHLSDENLKRIENIVKNGLEKAPKSMERKFGDPLKNSNEVSGHSCRFLQGLLGEDEKIFQEIMRTNASKLPRKGKQIVAENLVSNAIEYIKYAHGADLGWHTDDETVEVTMVIMFSK